MSIQVADGFSLKSKKPLDERIQYASVAEMKEVPEANLYDGCTAYITATKKKYTFDSSNTVDPTTGKWREDNAGGGGGSSTLSGLDDVDISEPSDGQSLIYDEETESWKNGNGGASDLSNLGDVDITDPAEGEVLSYDATEDKWKNVPNSSGGDPAVINGYAYVQPMTTIMDYINCINRMSDSDKQISVSDPTIFNGKGCTALYMFLGPKKAYLLFSEYGFTIDPYSLSKSGVYTYVSSRHATDETNHPGYRANSFTYTNGITSLESVTIKGSSETDCDGIADNDKTGKLYYIGNVLFRSSTYDSNIVLIENPLLFYSDAAHTQLITPQTGKLYVDNVSKKTYEWNGTEYVEVGGAVDYNDAVNKPKINNIELSGNRSAANLGLASTADVNAKQNQFQFTTMPTASATYAGKTVQFIGATAGGFTHNYFYECVENSGSYSWQVSQVQSNPSSTGHTIVNSSDESMAARAKLKFGDGFNVTDDSTDNETIVEPTSLATGDMDDIVFPLPTVPHPNTNCGFTPVGTVISVMGNSAPLHYLACNGQTVNIADYPELADYFEAQFGTKNHFGGNGTTTFAVPDLAGEFLRGAGTNNHTNQGSGGNVGVHQDATGIPHVGYNQSENILYAARPANGAHENSDSTYTHNVASDNSRKFTSSGSWTDESSKNFYTARPTNTSVLYCIATKDIYINPLLDYSTTEKVVGTWVDGKTLYQRTFSGTTPADSSSANFASLDGMNVDEIVSVSGYLIKPESVSNNTYRIANSFSWKVWANRTAIRQSESDSGYYSLSAYVTIQYTKTTS